MLLTHRGWSSQGSALLRSRGLEVLIEEGEDRFVAAELVLLFRKAVTLIRKDHVLHWRARLTCPQERYHILR